MCYGENVPPLSFEGIHVACLCGDNGSGKSALLDAMTWALWGKSRADADDDLIYRDRADMEVDFEFIAQGKGYRVLRKHGRGTAARSGSTLLTLQSAGEGVYNDISGNTKSETQQKLIELLRLDYKTFRNSAYLVQGKANEFTVADPAERKRVLAAILDLSQYDELSDMAHDRSVERGNEGSRLEGIITGMEAEIATKPSCLSDLASHQSLLMAAEARRAEAEKDLNATEQASKDLEIKQSQLKLLQSSQAQASAELSRWMQRSRVLTSQIAEYEGVEAEQEAIVAGHTSLLLQDAENAQLNEKAQRLLELTAGAARLALAIERAQNMVLAEHDSSQKKLDEARTKAATLPDLEAQAARTRAELQVLAATEEALVEKRRRAAELTSAADNTRSNNERLSAEVRQIEEKLAMLSAKGARCPLCQSDLGEDGVERVRANYQAERAEKRRYIREGAGQAETSASERRSIEAEIARIEPVMKAEKASRQTRLGRLEHEIAAAREAAASIGADQERLAQLERRLAERDFATVEQKAHVELSTQISALAYDPAHHNEVKRRLRDSAQFQAKWNHLEQALKRLPQMRSDLAATEETIAERRLQIDSERNRIDELARETSALPALANRVNEERTQYQSALRNEKLAREQIAVVQERLRRCEQLERDRAAREKELLLAREEESIYRQLGEAFGKKGIQALLIDQALPEVRREADRLLKRLTDNRMSVAINTQKATKKGTVVETLDIEVSDEFGETRKYEMFSGGEAFRIDFALRIALSRLLTHRAGASLSTIFVDEGFGTQDTSGREKLVQVINSIQDEFDRIFVITHLEELKDAFPTRVEVSRSPQGSVIAVN